jgi:hypothetical protein
MKIKILLTTLFFILSSTSYAATLVCPGTVKVIAYHSPDRIMVQTSTMNRPVFVCNPGAKWSVSGTSYSTSAETCKSLLSMFMHAKASKLRINSLYFDGSDVPTKCNGWGAWKRANIRFITY